MFHFNVLVVSWKGKTNTQSPSPAERLPSLDRSSRVLSYTISAINVYIQQPCVLYLLECWKLLDSYCQIIYSICDIWVALRNRNKCSCWNELVDIQQDILFHHCPHYKGHPVYCTSANIHNTSWPMRTRERFIDIHLCWFKSGEHKPGRIWPHNTCDKCLC